VKTLHLSQGKEEPERKDPSRTKKRLMEQGAWVLSSRRTWGWKSLHNGSRENLKRGVEKKKGGEGGTYFKGGVQGKGLGLWSEPGGEAFLSPAKGGGVLAKRWVEGGPVIVQKGGTIFVFGSEGNVTMTRKPEGRKTFYERGKPIWCWEKT